MSVLLNDSAAMCRQETERRMLPKDTAVRCCQETYRTDIIIAKGQHAVLYQDTERRNVANRHRTVKLSKERTMKC